MAKRRSKTRTRVKASTTRAKRLTGARSTTGGIHSGGKRMPKKTTIGRQSLGANHVATSKPWPRWSSVKRDKYGRFTA